MIRSNRKNAKTLVGLFCLPTSSRYHMAEPQRSGAYHKDQVAYLLEATQSVEDGGYPPMVVLTADPNELMMVLGEEPATQHAEVRKNLPPRKVSCILYPHGTVEGTLPPKGSSLPHWSFIRTNEDGSASLAAIEAAKALLETNRKAAKEAKETPKASTAPAAPETPAPSPRPAVVPPASESAPEMNLENTVEKVLEATDSENEFIDEETDSEKGSREGADRFLAAAPATFESPAPTLLAAAKNSRKGRKTSKPPTE